MEGTTDSIEVKPIDKWNSRVLTAIVFGYVYYHILSAAALHVATKQADAPADAKMAFFGVLIASGLIALAMSIAFTAKVFYPVMALQREMIGEVWELLKKAWHLMSRR